jgi:LacI family transcriptional regulator
MPSPSRVKRRIAVLLPTEDEFGRRVLLGAAKYCLSHGFAVVHLRKNDPKHIAQLAASGVVGIVAAMRDGAMRDAVRPTKLAAVDVLGVETHDGIPAVACDDDAIGRLASDHLVGRGFRELAYCGPRGDGRSAARAASFAAAAKAARVNCTELDVADIVDASRFRRSAFVMSLRESPRPVGVLCNSDLHARGLIEACDAVGLRVPQDVAVVGVDNDQVICQGLEPMLTSVDPNGYRIGHDAVAVLDRILAGKGVPDRTLVPPLGIVPRGSTNTTPSEDVRVGQALDYVHAHADRPINVTDVARRVGASRRTLERRFRATLGKSVAGAIRTAHVELAKQLLIDTDLTLEQVAESSGMNYLRQMRIVFTKDVGVSPSQFRRQFKGG